MRFVTFWTGRTKERKEHMEGMEDFVGRERTKEKEKKENERGKGILASGPWLGPVYRNTRQKSNGGVSSLGQQQERKVAPLTLS